MSSSQVPEVAWQNIESAYSLGGKHFARYVANQCEQGDLSDMAIQKHCERQGIRAGSMVEPPTDHTKLSVDHDIEIKAYKREVDVLRGKYEEVTNRASMDQILGNMLIEHRERMPTPTLKSLNVENPKLAQSEESIVLLLTDLHVGEVVSGQAMHNINKYDVPTFLARMEALHDKIVMICFDRMQGYKFPELVIYCLGDLINGQFAVMHDELLVTSAYSLMETVYGTAYVLTQFIASMLEYFETVRLVPAPGNHGRMTKKPWAKEATMNWDIVIPQIVSTKFWQEPRVKFSFTDSFFFLDEVRGWRNLGLHGHQIKGWAGIPYYGINRIVGNLDEVLIHNGIEVHNVVLGHFHTQAVLDKVGGQTIIGPCMKGADEFTLSAGFKPSPAGQTMFGMHEEQNITHQWRLNLQDAYEPRGFFEWWDGNETSLGEHYARIPG